MLRRRPPKTLRRICLEKIADDIEMWYDAYKDRGIATEIDAASAHDLRMVIIRKNRSVSVRYLKFLIVPSLTKIRLSQYGTYEVDKNDIVDTICKTCHTLQSLDMSLCDNITPDYLAKAATVFGHSLTKLTLLGAQVNDAVLEAIGGSCHKLRHLDISSCKFTQKGLESLFYTSISGGCRNTREITKSIEYLNLLFVNIEDDVMEKCISWLLEDCTKLQTVIDSTMPKSVFHLCQTKINPPKLHLKSGHFALGQLRDYTGYFPLLKQCLPELDLLGITHKVGTEMSVFHLLSSLGKSLRKLGLTWSFPPDFLLYIPYFCPELESLEVTVTKHFGFLEIQHAIQNGLFNHFNLGIDVIIDQMKNFHLDFSEVRQAFENFVSENGQASSEDASWSRLKKFSIEWQDYGNHSGLSMRPVLERILKESSLTYFHVNKMPQDGGIDEFLLWALDNNCFESLETLSVYDDHFTVDSLQQLIFAPNVKNISTTFEMNMEMNRTRTSKN